jgi:hypothetical protein
MTVRASTISGLFDAANSVVLREAGLTYTETHHSPGIPVPRKGLPYWEDNADYDFTVRVSFTTTGTGPHSIEIWAANGEIPDAPIAGIGLPDAGSGEVRGLVCASALRVIPSNEPLFLSAKVIVGDGTVDAGVTLERVS